jgi:hypothetical protein
MTTDEFALYDAAYVLDALSPAERREFETHVKGCAACARSTDDLAGLTDLMSMVSVEEVNAQPEALPETLLPSLVRAVRREQVQSRLAVGTAAAAAACLIAVGAVALTRPDSPARPPVASSASTDSGTTNRAMSAVAPSPVTASARLVDVAWGTRIDLTCRYSPKGLPTGDGRPYALVVVDRSGAAQQVAAWKALPHRELTVVGASSLARQDIAAVEIRTLSGRAILRLTT